MKLVASINLNFVNKSYEMSSSTSANKKYIYFPEN